jgi:hypothetical protein
MCYLLEASEVDESLASDSRLERSEVLLAVECTRITNGPGPAFDQLRAIANDTKDPNQLAILALIRADAGDFSAARASVDALASTPGDALPLLPRLRQEVLRRYIAAKERR